MTITELHQNLQEAYSPKNLNNISITLINLYQNQQYAILQKIAEIIREYVDIDISDDGKGFSKLMMLYHPDRLHFHLSEINRLVEQNNFDGLLNYAHVLKLERIEEIASSINSFEDIDYSPVYDWDFDTEGFSIISDGDIELNVKTGPKTYNFYNAIKIRQYGETSIEFPTNYLEDFDEFELSSSDIDDLEGVQFCIHAKSMDLSDNQIIDLTPLTGLIHLEELNISDNQIGTIDALSNLLNIKRLYLANNCVDDISPLFELDKLEYVDLSGNNIRLDQLNQLKSMGITIDY